MGEFMNKKTKFDESFTEKEINLIDKLIEENKIVSEKKLHKALQ